MMEKKDRSFLGRGWDFPPTFEKALNGIKMIADEEDINSSLEILLSTQVGERIMQPSYGCDMTNFLFEPIDTTLLSYMKDLINDAILYHEPRIILDGIQIDTDFYTEGKIIITINYTIARTNTRYNFVYPFYLNEGTGIKQ